MKKIVILLSLITCLLGQDEQDKVYSLDIYRNQEDSSLVYEIKIPNNEFSKQRQKQYKIENNQMLEFELYKLISYSKDGIRSKDKVEKIINIIEEYIKLERKYREDLYSLKGELVKLSK